MTQISKEMQAQGPSFEAGLQRMEQVVEQLESGNLTLEESMELFTEGIKLVRQCQEQLQAAERKVEQLLPTTDKEPTRQQLTNPGGMDIDI